jgi:Xaa-Pro aminopeptidase
MTTRTQSPGIFSVAEYESRLERARRLMRERDIDALVLSTEPNLLYFTGFYTQFFVSPTRPWFFVIPLDDEPCAIVPQLGVEPMTENTWVRNYRSWISPNPEDEGVSLVASYLAERVAATGRIGFEIGPESRLGFPVEDFLRIRERVAPREIVDCQELVRRLRFIKSEAEISCLRTVCRIVSDCFDRVPLDYRSGDSQRQIATRFKHQAFTAGIDRLPYLTFDSGQGGYHTAISGPCSDVPRPGEVFTMDTGCSIRGYFSDFNRNWAIGHAGDEARRAYQVLYAATEAGLAIVRPGVRASEIFQAQLKVIDEALPQFSNPLRERNLAGRFGHGLGLNLTEPPSNSPHDHTVLETGVVLTIEPTFVFSQSQLMLTEENIVVTEDGYELLSRRAPPELPIIDA